MRRFDTRDSGHLIRSVVGFRRASGVQSAGVKSAG